MSKRLVLTRKHKQILVGLANEDRITSPTSCVQELEREGYIEREGSDSIWKLTPSGQKMAQDLILALMNKE